MATSVDSIFGSKRRALDSLVERLMVLGNVSKAEADKVAGLYLKHKLVKLDGIGGNFTVRHGALLDAKTIRGAAAS